jgi:hypothetical protein
MDTARVLIKVFSWRFYRENSGFLLFSYVSVISYCFFIKTAGVYPPEQSVFYHLMLMMTFIVSPAVMLLVFLLFLLYTIKSWRYVGKQLKHETNQFLYYSFCASSKTKQFGSLFLMQLVILLPLIGYWLFATILGIVYKANLIPVVTFLYILTLGVISSLIYLFQINRIVPSTKRSSIGRLSKHWKKPYSTLFLYYILRRLGLSLILTKVCTLLLIASVYSGYGDLIKDERVPGIIMLGVVLAHSFLIYKDHHFKETYLSFSRNMPYRPFAVLKDFSLMLLVLIVPELIWLFATHGLWEAMKTALLAISLGLLLRSLIYLTGLQIYRYLIWTFCLFVIEFYIVMYNQIWLLFSFNTLVSLAIFYSFYYKPNQVISHS